MAAKVVGMAVPMIVMPYILRVLGTESYGKIAYVQSLMSYFTLLSILGLSDLSLRECSIVRNDSKLFTLKVSQVFSISLCTTGLSLVLYLLYIVFVPDVRAEYQLYLAYGLMIPASGLGMNWLYYTLERFDYVSVRDIVGKIIYLVLCFLLIRNAGDYVLYGVVMVVASSLIPVLFNHYGVWTGKCGVKPRIVFDESFVPYSKSIFYLGLMTLGSKLFSSSDVILVKWLVAGSGDASAGLYNSGIVLPLVVEQFLMVVAAVITPRLYMYLGNNDEKNTRELTNKIGNAMYFVAIPSVVTFLFFPGELLWLLGGDEYLPATNVARIYSLVLLTMVAITLAGTRTYIARRKEKKLFVILLSMAILNIALDFVFIRWWGITGAAVATVISNICLMVVELTLEKSWNLVMTKETVKYAVGGIAVAVTFAIVKPLMANQIAALFVCIGIAGVIYVALMMLLKESTLQIVRSKASVNVKKQKKK